VPVASLSLSFRDSDRVRAKYPWFAKGIPLMRLHLTRRTVGKVNEIPQHQAIRDKRVAWLALCTLLGVAGGIVLGGCVGLTTAPAPPDGIGPTASTLYWAIGGAIGGLLSGGLVGLFIGSVLCDSCQEGGTA